MRTLLLIAAVLITIGTVINVQASTGSSLFDKGIVRGTIIDSTDGNPLQFASVILQKVIDSTFVSGTATGTNGEFIFNNIIEGEYLLKINSLGYKNKFVANLRIKREHGEYNLGTLKLSKNAIELSQATVSGEKVGEELRLDKKVINVSQNINASGGTALDVLQNQPSVRVDQDGTVYLRGSSNFTILINGKPSVLQGSDALKQIAANNIDNIELITNPSARYDAEGTAGIINIILKKQTEYTFSGIANLNSGTRDKYNSDINFSYNMQGLNLTGGVDYRNNANFVNQDVTLTTYSTTGVINNSTLLKIKAKQQQYSARAGMDYAIDTMNSVSFTLSGGRYAIVRTIGSEIQTHSQSSVFFGENLGEMNGPVDYISTSLNYSHKFMPGINELSFEGTFSNVKIISDQITSEFTTNSQFDNRNADPVKVLFNNDAGRKEGRGKIDYKHNLNPKSTFEMGMQTNFSYRDFDVVDEKFDYNTNGYVNDLTISNKYNYKNNVYAGYLSYSNSLADFDFQIGVRGEYMDRKFTQETMASSYKYKKMDYFPSFNLSKKFDDHQLQLSYSRRVERPNENLLNPFSNYADRNLVTAGNPYLLPSYINAFELNYQKVFGSVFVSAQSYYRIVDNQFQQTFVMDNNGKMFSSFDNFAKSRFYGTELSSSFSIAQILRFDPAVEFSENSLKGTYTGRNIDMNFFNWNARLNTTVTLSQSTRFMISGNYYAKHIDAQVNIKQFFFLSASLKQDMFDKKLSVTLQARNILNSSKMDIGLAGTNYNGRVLLTNEIPVVSLMLSYNFNNFKRVSRPNDGVDIQTGL